MILLIVLWSSNGILNLITVPQYGSSDRRVQQNWSGGSKLLNNVLNWICVNHSMLILYNKKIFSYNIVKLYYIELYPILGEMFFLKYG